MRDRHTRDITVIGGSAGAIPVLRTLLGALPANYPGAIFVCLHVAPNSPAVLHSVLDRWSVLPVRLARHGNAIRRGQILVAPPDRHLMLGPAGVQLSHGPRENRYRPSIDVLFRSAAVVYGPRVTGVVLSGMLDDGAAGLWAIKQRGGVAVVQDPADAEYPDLPRNAMQTTSLDHKVPVAEMGPLLTALAQEPVQAMLDAPQSMVEEVRMASDQQAQMETMDRLGKRVPFTCPECGGSLWELGEDGGQRFRCHVGHAYTLRTLESEQTVRVEAALWAALRGLEEKERLERRMAAEATRRGESAVSSTFAASAESSGAHAEELRRLIAAAAEPMRSERPTGQVPHTEQLK